MVGLHYLKHTCDLSDEGLVARWVENPYWQYFCGEEYFQHAWPIHPTSLTKWRNRIQSKGLEAFLAETIRAGLQLKAITPREARTVVADTTVQEKAAAFPTDARSDCRLGRNYLKGQEGDRMNAILVGCGYNLRRLWWPLLFWLRFLYCFVQNPEVQSAVLAA